MQKTDSDKMECIFKGISHKVITNDSDYARVKKIVNEKATVISREHQNKVIESQQEASKVKLNS